MTKECSKCEKVLDESMFTKRTDSRDGLASRCKTCLYEGRKKAAPWVRKTADKNKYQREYSKANAEKRRVWEANARLKNPDRFAEKERRKSERKALAAGRVYKPTGTREKLNLTPEEMSVRKREQQKEYKKRWRIANPDEHKAQVSAKKQAYRTRKSGGGGKHTRAQVRNLLVSQKYLCVVCRVNIKETYHADHIVPVSKGGSSNIDNIQLLCPECNVKKSNKDPMEFMQSKGFLV